jgi:hypothetical protein
LAEKLDWKGLIQRNIRSILQNYSELTNEFDMFIMQLFVMAIYHRNMYEGPRLRIICSILLRAYFGVYKSPQAQYAE